MSDENAPIPYEENPMIGLLCENYEKSDLKDKLSLFEYCQLHIQSDQVAVLSQMADMYERGEMFAEDDFEIEGEKN